MVSLEEHDSKASEDVTSKLETEKEKFEPNDIGPELGISRLPSARSGSSLYAQRMRQTAAYERSRRGSSKSPEAITNGMETLSAYSSMNSTEFASQAQFTEKGQIQRHQDRDEVLTAESDVARNGSLFAKRMQQTAIYEKSRRENQRSGLTTA